MSTLNLHVSDTMSKREDKIAVATNAFVFDVLQIRNCSYFPLFIKLAQMYNKTANKMMCQLSVVDCLQSFGDVVKRRSLRRFFGPALFHQNQYAWMHALRLLLGKWRSVEWGISVFDSVHDTYVVQQTSLNNAFTAVVSCSTLPACTS